MSESKPLTPKEMEQQLALLKADLDKVTRERDAALLEASTNKVDNQNALTLIHTDSSEQLVIGEDGQPETEEVDDQHPRTGKSRGTKNLNLYWYRIDLPPQAGWTIPLGGIHYIHGERYKVNIYTLQALKEVVFRTWQHEALIKGDDENMYRKPLNTTLSGKARRAG